MSTTKGTGGDIIILEEAAYIDVNFAYETVFPLLIVGTTSLLAISTVTSEINFFTRLLRMRDKNTNLPMFTTLSVTLACNKCREDGKSAECPHMLHLVPRWQSGDRHIKLKTIMQDRPDLIESELSGLAFDSLQQVFKTADMNIMFTQPVPEPITNEPIHLFIDPAAGVPSSDYAILSITRQKGLITVRREEEVGLVPWEWAGRVRGGGEMMEISIIKEHPPPHNRAHGKGGLNPWPPHKAHWFWHGGHGCLGLPAHGHSGQNSREHVMRGERCNLNITPPDRNPLVSPQIAGQ